MKIIINKKEFDLEKQNKEFLIYANRINLIRTNNDEERGLLKRMLDRTGYDDNSIPEVLILCKKCKKRYPSNTAGERLHCDCNTVYWKSDGRVLYIEGKHEIILVNPKEYAKDSNASKG